MMFKLIKYELKKLCSTTFFKVILVAFLVINVILCAQYANEQIGYNMVYKGYIDDVYDLYINDPEEFESEYIKAKEQWEASLSIGEFPIGKYGDKTISDYEIFEEVKKIVSADDEFHKKLQSIIILAKRIQKNFETTGKPLESFKYRYNGQLVDIYTHIDENVTLDAAPLKGWRELFTYELDFYLVLILIAICCVTIATNDRRNGFYAIAGTTHYGRKESALAKYISLLIIIAMLVLVFMLSSLISVGFVCGYSSPLNAVHAVAEMDAFPFVANMIEAQLVIYVLRFFAMASFALVLFALSVVVKNQILCFGTAFLVYLLNSYVYSLHSYEVGQWKHLSLMSLYFADQFIISYRALEFLDYSINLIWVFVVAMVFVFAVTLIVSLCCYSMRTTSKLLNPINFLKKLKIERKSKEKREHTVFQPRGLLSFELYKHRVVAFLLIILLVGKVYSSIEYFKSDDSAFDRIYRMYLEEVGGEYSEEKNTYLYDQQIYYQRILNQYDSMREKYWNGQIETKEFQDYISQYMEATVRLDVLTILTATSNDLSRLYEQKGILGSFVYETGYKMHASRGADLLLIIFVAFLSCRFYLYENEKTISGTPMDVVNRTSKKGRMPLYVRKLAICVSAAAISAVIFGAVDWYFLLQNYEMPDMSATLLSMQMYSGAPNISIMAYTVLIEIFGVLGTVMLAVICFSAAAIIKRMMLTYAIVAAGILVPRFAAQNGGVSFAYFDTTMLQNPDSLFRIQSNLPAIVTALIFFGIFAVLMAVLTYLSARRVKKGV